MPKSQFVLVAVVFSAVAAVSAGLLAQNMKPVPSGPQQATPQVAAPGVPPVGNWPGQYTPPSCAPCQAMPSYAPVTQAIPSALSLPCQQCYVNDMNSATVWPFRVEYAPNAGGWGYHNYNGMWTPYTIFR